MKNQKLKKGDKVKAVFTKIQAKSILINHGYEACKNETSEILELNKEKNRKTYAYLSSGYRIPTGWLKKVKK